MEFNYSYAGSSAVRSDAQRTQMRFAPDLLRTPTYLRGTLGQQLPFREAMSALHEVVVSDLKWRPKSRPEYEQWLAGQEQRDLDLVAAHEGALSERVTHLRSELDELDRRRRARHDELWKAKSAYFDYLYKRDKDAWYVLDPVVTVHPDEVFFECFSRDESSYGRLGVDYSVFETLDEFACGTTNVDYSEALYAEFQKIRTYKATRLEVDPSGFATQTQDAASFSDTHKEVKIDLPESWVRGFLQVSSAMSLPAAARIELHPMDVHNICFVLRRRREKQGPRSLRYVLRPGEPVKLVFDPWGLEVECPRSRYLGDEAQEIRVWGRRRLHILERLVPVAQRFTVVLLGTGLPSFYVADLGALTFTLGLSGWTANDWASAGNFDLLAPRAAVDTSTAQRVFDGLGEVWQSSADALSARLGLERSTVLGALSAWTQAGRAMYDLHKGVYRKRELSREPLPVEALRFANAREASASALVERGQVGQVTVEPDTRGWLALGGAVRDDSGEYSPRLTIDGDARIESAECSCYFHQSNRLRKGPCEHILALRLQHTRSAQPVRCVPG